MRRVRVLPVDVKRPLAGSYNSALRSPRRSGTIHQRSTQYHGIQWLHARRVLHDSSRHTKLRSRGGRWRTPGAECVGLSPERVVATRGGYVDRVDPFTGATVDRDANWSQRHSVSAAVTLAPSERVRITPAFNDQSVEIRDTSAFYTYLSDPGSGVLKNGCVRSTGAEGAGASAGE
jgi:hypothetical protein